MLKLLSKTNNVVWNYTFKFQWNSQNCFIVNSLKPPENGKWGPELWLIVLADFLEYFLNPQQSGPCVEDMHHVALSLLLVDVFFNQAKLFQFFF